MTRIPAAIGTTPTDRSFATTNAINDIDLSTFLDIMIAELQNQDPLNPLDNKDMLAQISQLREVGATDKLTATLESVLIGQNLTSSISMIGSEVDALSDDNQRVSGVVSRVSLENGEPKLHLDLGAKGEPSIESGSLEKGTYSYHIVWHDEKGELQGIALEGEDAISTEDSRSDYQSIWLRNLPKTDGPKRIYRTDASGVGNYQLVGTITDGSQSSHLDTVADDERTETLIKPFFQDQAYRKRSFTAGLNNIAEIRRPGE
jgi:flagellar basal-body rod modification protein FlgD